MAPPEGTGRRRLRAHIGSLALLSALVPGCGSDTQRHRADAAVVMEAVVIDAHESGVTCPVVEDDFGAEVSFSSDLMPFFSVSCAFGGCHDEQTHQAGLDLGPNVSEGPADTAAMHAVHDSLLAAATTTPDLPRVAPHDPSRSFLMLKLEGCQNALGLTCTHGVRGLPCGARMPYLSPPLAPAQRAMLARWIGDGALFSVGD